MKLRFLGTRGHIEAANQRHARHSSLMVSYHRRRVMIDCGLDWLGHIERLRPHAIVLTHAHPDHAEGLQEGAPCAVYATDDSWEHIEAYPIEDRHRVEARVPFDVCGMTFEAYPLIHSVRCPAVAYRVTAGRPSVLYCPDVVYIENREEALRQVRMYIGDGATPARSMVRKRGDMLVGHTPIRTQVTWCQKEGVPRAVFTHCGTQVVAGDERLLRAQLDEWGRERGVQVLLAHDGLEITLR